MQGSNKRKDLSQKGQSSTSTLCAICKPSDPETVSILHGLLQKFTVKKNEGFSAQKSRQYDKFDVINFHRLLSTVFGKKYHHFKDTFTCSHEGLRNHFCKILKCSAFELDQISDQITWKRAKYHYHIEVLNQQIRSFPRLLESKKLKNSQKRRSSNQQNAITNTNRCEKSQQKEEIDKIKTQAKIEDKEDVLENQKIVQSFPDNYGFSSVMLSNNKDMQMNINMNYGGLINPVQFMWGYPYQTQPNFPPMIQFREPNPPKDNNE